MSSGQTDLFRQRILNQTELDEWFVKLLKILGD